MAPSEGTPNDPEPATEDVAPPRLRDGLRQCGTSFLNCTVPGALPPAIHGFPLQGNEDEALDHF